MIGRGRITRGGWTTPRRQGTSPKGGEGMIRFKDFIRFVTRTPVGLMDLAMILICAMQCVVVFYLLFLSLSA